MSWRNLLSSRVQADAETDEAALKRASMLIYKPSRMSVSCVPDDDGSSPSKAFNPKLYNFGGSYSPSMLGAERPVTAAAPS